VRACRREPEHDGTARERTTVTRTALPWDAPAGFVRNKTCEDRVAAGAARTAAATAAMRSVRRGPRTIASSVSENRVPIYYARR
jgi:hypothetical protein